MQNDESVRSMKLARLWWLCPTMTSCQSLIVKLTCATISTPAIIHRTIPLIMTGDLTLIFGKNQEFRRSTILGSTCTSTCLLSSLIFICECKWSHDLLLPEQNRFVLLPMEEELKKILLSVATITAKSLRTPAQKWLSALATAWWVHCYYAKNQNNFLVIQNFNKALKKAVVPKAVCDAFFSRRIASPAEILGEQGLIRHEVLPVAMVSRKMFGSAFFSKLCRGKLEV